MSESKPTQPNPEPPPVPTPKPAPGPTPGQKHEDQIRADRACIGCGFNLYGQSVVREPHYNLAIARCPECGEVAALQSYPVMTHWVNRFRALIAGVWVVALIIIFFIQVSLSGTYAFGMSTGAAQILARTIGEQYTLWAQEHGQTVSSPFGGAGTNPYYEWVDIPRDWADAHVPALIDQVDAWRVLYDTGVLVSAIPAAMIAFILGVFWSIVLLGATRKRVALVPILAACLVVVFMFTPGFTRYGALQAQMIAQSYYANLIGPWVMLLQLPFSLLGILVGRKVARWVIKLALPPRARIPFAVFWTRDGLDPPKPEFR